MSSAKNRPKPRIRRRDKPDPADIDRVLAEADAIGRGVGGEPASAEETNEGMRSTDSSGSRTTRRKAAAGAPRERLTVKLPPELVTELRGFCAGERASLSYGVEVLLQAGLDSVSSLPEPDTDP